MLLKVPELKIRTKLFHHTDPLPRMNMVHEFMNNEKHYLLEDDKDIRITKSFLNKLKPIWAKACEDFFFDMRKFHIADVDTNFSPHATMMCWRFAFDKLKVMDLSTLTMCLINSASFEWHQNQSRLDFPQIIHLLDEEVLFCRAMNFVANFLRELQLCYECMKIDPQCKLYKNMEKDAKSEWDIKLIRSDTLEMLIHLTINSRRAKDLSKRKDHNFGSGDSIYLYTNTRKDLPFKDTRGKNSLALPDGEYIYDMLFNDFQQGQ